MEETELKMDIFDDDDQDVFYCDDDSDSCSMNSSPKLNFLNDINAPKTCLVCGDPTNCCHYGIFIYLLFLINLRSL